MELNTPQEVANLLKKDKISPKLAKHIINKMFTLFEIEYVGENPSKAEVLKQIELLQTIEKPIHFNQQTQTFSVKDVFKI